MRGGLCGRRLGSDGREDRSGGSRQGQELNIRPVRCSSGAHGQGWPVPAAHLCQASYRVPRWGSGLQRKHFADGWSPPPGESVAGGHGGPSGTPEVRGRCCQRPPCPSSWGHMLAHRLWNRGLRGPSASQLNRFRQVSRAWEDYGTAETPVARTRLLSIAGGMCLHTTTGPDAARPGQHDREADRRVYKQCWLPEGHSVGSQECPSPCTV